MKKTNFDHKSICNSLKIKVKYVFAIFMQQTTMIKKVICSDYREAFFHFWKSFSYTQLTFAKNYKTKIYLTYE